MIVCILGMHKSGTTLVAETLHHSGVHMADVPDELGYDDSNKFERHAAQRINRGLIAPALVPTWKGHRRRNAGLDRAGYEINLDSLAWVRRGRLAEAVATADIDPVRRLAAQLDAQHGDWGFKDPRTCLTYEWWRRGLPDHRVVAVFRPFTEVLMRYKVSPRRPVRLARVARSWLVHNELLIEHLEHRSDHVVLRYDGLMSGDEEFARLQAYLGTELVDRRRPDLYRARAGEHRDDPARWLPSVVRRRAGDAERRLDELRSR